MATLKSKNLAKSKRKSPVRSTHKNESHSVESDRIDGWEERGNLSSNTKRDYQDNRSYGFTDQDDREQSRGWR